MVWEKRRKYCFVNFARVAGQRHILFFVNRFQLSVETADHAILKTFCLNFCPVVNLIAGDIFRVASNVKTGVGICSVGTDGGHQFVIFVGDGIFGCFVGDAVDFCINSFTFKAVRSLAINFELFFDLVKQRLFYFIVLSTEVRGAFKHQVLEIVSQSGSFCGVVFTTYTYCNVRLYARCFLVYSHVDFQTVVQSVDARFQRIVGYCFVAVLRRTTT